jgi:hypothetical protein
MRRVSADSARSLRRNQSRARPRITGESATGTASARSAPTRATRRTTAFTRSSRVERNGAENIFWSFSERQTHFARRYDEYRHYYLLCQANIPTAQTFLSRTDFAER